MDYSSSLSNGVSSTGVQGDRNLNKTHPKERYDEVPYVKAVMTYIQYAILIFWGYVNDWLRSVGLKNDCALRKDVS